MGATTSTPTRRGRSRGSIRVRRWPGRPTTDRLGAGAARSVTTTAARARRRHAPAALCLADLADDQAAVKSALHVLSGYLHALHSDRGLGAAPHHLHRSRRLCPGRQVGRCRDGAQLAHRPERPYRRAGFGHPQRTRSARRSPSRSATAMRSPTPAPSTRPRPTATSSRSSESAAAPSPSPPPATAPTAPNYSPYHTPTTHGVPAAAAPAASGHDPARHDDHERADRNNDRAHGKPWLQLERVGFELPMSAGLGHLRRLYLGAVLYGLGCWGTHLRGEGNGRRR